MIPLVPFVSHALAVTSPAVAITAIDLEPEKTILRADGRSTSVLTARVFDDRGAPVADGTRIQFSTTLGRLDTLVAETRGGFARVILTAADQPGIATITANLEAGGAVPARRQITFSNDVQAVEQRDRWLRFTGSSYVSMAMLDAESRYIDVLGKKHDARVTYGPISVTADHIQFRLGTTQVFAQGSVILEVGKKRLRCYRLRYDLVQQIGLAETATGLIELQAGGAERVVPAEEASASTAVTSWRFADLSGASLVVSAGSIALNQESVLQFRQATFYIGGQKAFSTPFHIMTLRQQSLYREQLIGVGASGMWLNLPYYYNVQPQGVGTVFLRRGAPFGSSVYSQRVGWTLDLEQTYNGKNSMEGQLQVLNLANTNRGLRLQHSQKFDPKTDGSLFVDLAGGRDLFSSGQLGHNFNDFRVNVVAALNRYRGVNDTAGGTAIPASGDWRVQTIGESYPKLLLPKSKVRYTLSGSATEQHFFGGSSDGRTIKTQNLGTRLFAEPIKLSKQLTFTQSGVLGYTQVDAPAGTNGVGRSGASIQATSAFAFPIQVRSGNLGSVQLSYDYFQTPPLFVVSAVTPGTTPSPGIPNAIKQGRQRVSMTTFLNKDERWSFSLNGSRGLDQFQSTLYTEARVALRGPWSTRVRLTETQFTGGGYRDWEYSLIRMVNGREVALYYSTIVRRLQLDLTGLSF